MLWSEAREASGSETARLHHAARRRCGGVALAACAQQPTVPVIGYLSSRSPDETAHLVAAFRRGLGDPSRDPRDVGPFALLTASVSSLLQ
jgi:hypothetical protein